MPKLRHEPFKKKLFNLSEEVITKIKEESSFLGLKESNFVEFIINQYTQGINPNEQLKASKLRLDKIRKELSDEETRYLIINDHVDNYKKWMKEKESKKPIALQNIRKKIDIKDYEDAERIAKNWARMLGISPIQLLMEAKQLEL